MFTQKLRFLLFFIFACRCVDSYSQKITTFQHTYGISHTWIYGSSVVALPDKGFLTAGAVLVTNSSVQEILLIRTDSMGRQIWSKTYSGTGTGNISTGIPGTNYLLAGVDVILSPEGNVVVCSNTFKETEVYLFKINLKGSVLWSKTFPGGNKTASTLGLYVINASNGGYLLTGASTSNSTHGEVLVIKTDTAGNTVWSKVYYHAGFQGAGIRVTPSWDGGYLIGGFSEDTIPNSSNFTYPGKYLIMKIDKNGKLLWSRVYSGSTSSLSSSSESANSIAELPDGSIYVCGQGNSISNYFGATLMKMDSTGNLLWSKIYYSSNIDNLYFRTGLYDSLKKVINISCEFEGTSSGAFYTGVLRLDTSGEIIFGKTLGPSSLSEIFYRAAGHDFLHLSNGNFVMIQSVYISPAAGISYFLVKMDSGANSDNCNTSVFPIAPSSYPVNYLYSYTSASISTTVGSGCTVADVTLNDSLFCAPFVANFGWLYQCDSNKTLFQDSSYYKPTTWQWDFGDPASGSNTSTMQNPTHIYARSGIYTVKLVAGNGTQIDSITKKVTIHNPPPPTIEYATVISDNEIDITFQKSDTNNIKLYKVYRSTNGGPYQQAGSLNNISNADTIYLFKDNSVNTPQGQYAYKIVAINSCGAASDTSIIHQPILLKEKALGCTPIIQLNWTAYVGWASLPGNQTGIKKYEIYRSVNSGQESLLASVNNTVTLYNDTGLDYHNTYCYRVLAYDNTDSFVSWSDQVCGHTSLPDSVVILAVSKTSTSPNNGTVVIRWKNVNSAHLAYTELFYSADRKLFNKLNGPTANGGFPPSVDSFVQAGLNTQTADEFYYMITVDSCGKISPPSVTSKTMTLTVSVGQLLHKLNWTPYLGFKIKEYKIERFEKGQFATIDSVPGIDTFSKIFPAPCNYAIRYRIAAIGYDSGETAWSDTMGRQAIDTIPSDPPVMRNATVLSGSSAKINFTGSDSADTYEFAIERSVDGNWGMAGTILFTKPGDSLQYIDSNINTIKNNICYTVIALDSCLNASASDTVCLVKLSTNGLYCSAKVQLSWPQLSKPPALPDSALIYRSTDGTNYTPTASVNYISDVYSDTSVIPGKPYYYVVAAVYNKGHIMSYSDTVQVTPHIIPDADSAQLIYATIIKSDETRGAILIQWKRALLNDTNARGYYVYSYNPTNGKYALLKDVTDLNDTSYVQDNINTIQNIYKYYIITYNVCDVGINSNIHKTVLLKVQNNNLNEQLNWTNYFGVIVKSYSVYKSEDGGPQNLLANAGIDSALSDSDVSCNHSFTYQIQAILSNGEISFSDSITVKSFDTIRPRTKPILLATILESGLKDGRIKLDWNSAFDNNLEGYNIYRSSDGIGWSLIIDHWPGTSLIDTGLDTYDQSYYYKIQPVDSCGNVGPYTTYHETIHLKASANNGYNQLYWNGYAGWGVKEYLVYKNGTLVATLGNNVFAFKDTAVICQNVYQYLVKAIDSVNDTIVSSSNTDSAKAQNHIPPKAVYIKTVSVSKPNKAVTISWSPSTSYDVKDYVIYRKSYETGNLKFVDSTGLTTYIDSSQYITEPDCYYVFARDHCGNLSNGSNEGCIIVLNAKNQPGYNDLSWNSYQNWPDGVQSYNVYKQEDSTGWQLIGTTSSVQINEFEDKNLGDSTISFCYQVEAIENPGQYNQLSRSTVECVHQDATVFIPNSFTPYNQDGVNDLFGPKGAYIKDYSMQIYNRWGELVYASPSPSGEGRGEAGWDGTYKGQPVQQGIYIYLITVEDYNGKKSYFKGTITMFE